MYKDNSQLRIKDFVFPYGKLDPENDWVKLAELVPWDVVEERYAGQFVNNGHPAHPARMALGALLIQRRLKCSDEWLVKHVRENPYLQYFIGMKEYGPCPFGASTLVAFRKRFSERDMAAILEASVPKAEKEEKEDSDNDNDPPNSGTLVLDATSLPRGHRLPPGCRSAQSGAGESGENGGRTVQRYRAEEAPDVPQTRPEGLPPPIQEQKTQWESDPFRHPQTASIHPPGCGIHSPIGAKWRETVHKAGRTSEYCDHCL